MGRPKPFASTPNPILPPTLKPIRARATIAAARNIGRPNVAAPKARSNGVAHAMIAARTSPAIANHHIYCRNAKGALVCLEVK